MMGKPLVNIEFLEMGRTLNVRRGSNLLQCMRDSGIAISAECGGAGTCGKCRIYVDGESVLACEHNVDADCVVRFRLSGIVESLAEVAGELPSGVGGGGGSAPKRIQPETLSDSASAAPEKLAQERNSATGTSMALSSGKFAIAIDLGTTTIAIKLLDLDHQEAVAQRSMLNPQSIFGADVMSRIEAAKTDAVVLAKPLRRLIDRTIQELLMQSGIAPAQVGKLVVAANTAMSYILLGYPCSSLAQHPFIPEFTIPESCHYSELFDNNTIDVYCTILPYLSAFIGGDIFAGLCSLCEEQDFMLIDLGTNGEMLYRHQDRIVATSTAAGPAFEGASIECGIGFVSGAISAVWASNGLLRYETIADGSPIGVCGSGILDLAAALLELSIVDSSGLMNSPCDRVMLYPSATIKQRFDLADAQVSYKNPAPTANQVFFTQKDMREFQLAKSAIRSGIDILLAHFEGKLPSKVYLAGGFGHGLNVASALSCGLLPKSFAGVTSSIGNCSLRGAEMICYGGELEQAGRQMSAHSQEINLATHPKFSDLFISNLDLKMY